MHDKAVFLPSSACRCGRPYHGYRAASIARWDDMMKIKGMNIWPSMLDDLVMTHPEVREYRGFVEADHVHAREVMRIIVDFKSEVSHQRRESFIDELRSQVKGKTFVTPLVQQASEPLPSFTFKPARWTDSRK